MNATQTAAVNGTPLTTQNIAEAAPGLLRNSIDERIVRIRPMSTPIDQLSRCGMARRASAMTVEYYSVNTKETQTALTAALAEGRNIGADSRTYVMHTNNDEIFEPSDTVLFPAVMCLDANEKKTPFVVYVVGKAAAGGVEVFPINLNTTKGMGTVTTGVPATKAGDIAVRMGRAATELDVQTPQFAVLPRKAANNCQIFKMQVEQSTLAQIAEKEVGWSFNDQEEAAVIDMRLGMEKSFIFGMPAKIYMPDKGEYVYLTGGIWNQAEAEHDLILPGLTENDLIEMCRKAFTGNNGSKRKILIAGSGLMTALSKLEYTKSIRSGETKVKWGIEFKEFVSNFGTLYIVHSEVFDQCGHENDGFIVDPNYMTKYVHVPFQAEKLDLRKSGQRNTDAVVLTEASCLVLRYPKAHMRVKGTVQ